MAASITGFQSEGTIPSSGLRIPPRFLLTMVALLSLILMNISAILLTRLTDRPSDVFAPYTAILGQSKTVAISHGFSCRMSTYPTLPDEYCTHKLMTGPFAQVGLVMTGGIVSRIDFTLRGDAFKVGDAVLLWGRPTLHRQEHVVDLFWTNRGVNASTYSTSGRLSYLLPLWNLSFSVDRAG